MAQKHCALEDDGPYACATARAVEGALYGGEQKRARHGPLRCDEEAFVQVDRNEAQRAVQVRQRLREQCTSRNHGVTRMFCKLGGELVDK